MSKYYTLQDIAEVLNVHIDTVRRWARNGDLKADRLKRAYRVTQEQLDDFLKGDK